MSIIKPGALVFDIGAHHGESAELFLKEGAGQVIAVEPSTRNWMRMYERIQEKELHKIVPVHAAAYSHPDVVQLAVSHLSDGLSTLNPQKWKLKYPGEMEGCTPEPVVATTIDILAQLFGRPDYIKIDVEGLEHDVLRGMTRWFPEYVTIEHHKEFMEDALSCLSYLQMCGYRYASYTETDYNIHIEPVTPINEFVPELINNNPSWSNITVKYDSIRNN